MGRLLDEGRALAAAIPYSPDEDEHDALREQVGDGPDPGSIEALIQYKDALEDWAFALAGRLDDLDANLREQLRKAEVALARLGEFTAALPPPSPERLVEEVGGQFELSRRAGALAGAVDAWRIALGYVDVPASSRASIDAHALDRINRMVPLEDEWRSAADFMENVAAILREVREPVLHYAE
jgi:hypothetical protein